MQKLDSVHPGPQNGVGGVGAAHGHSAATKPQLQNPITRQPYRPAAQRRERSRGRCLCQCCIWTTIVILFLILLAAAAASVLYLLYRPHSPVFTATSLRISRFNLSDAGASADSPRLSSNLSLAVSARNPNSKKVAFLYDQLTVTAMLRGGAASLGYSSFPAFDLLPKNTTLIKATIVSSQVLDADAVTALRSDLKRKKVPLEVRLDTKGSVKIGGWKSKKLGFRVSCPLINGIPPKGGKSAESISSGVKCDARLRIKIWKFTF